MRDFCGGSELCKYCLIVEFNQVGSATNGPTPPSHIRPSHISPQLVVQRLLSNQYVTSNLGYIGHICLAKRCYQYNSFGTSEGTP